MRQPLLPVLIMVLGTAGATSAATPEVAASIDRAVVSGNLADLQSIRASLLARLKADKNAAVRYDIAYVGWRMAQLLREDEPKKANKMLKESQKYLDALLKKEEENAEAWALRGSVIGERISGMFSGIFLGPKAGSSLDHAATLAPSNPRVALQRGIGWFFTPKTFGGGLENSERELRRAQELFNGEPAGKSWPDWGRVDALVWLGQVLVETGDYSEARSLYKAALAMEPKHAWIRDELMPALEQKELLGP